MHRALRFAYPLVAGLLAMTAMDQAVATESEIRLTITSSTPGTPFNAVCTVITGDTRVVEDHSGMAPATVTFHADSVRCELDSAGPLEVTAEGPRGNRTRSSTTGGHIVLWLS